MTPDEAQSLGRAIRAVRTERGLSQTKIAFSWQIGPVGTASPAIRYFDSGDSVLLGAGGVVCSGWGGASAPLLPI